MFNTARVEALEVENLIECAQATIVSAAARKECRGAHTVKDYERPADDPQYPLGRNDAEWMKHTLWYSEGNRLDYKPVQLKPLTRGIDPAQGADVLDDSRRSEPSRTPASDSTYLNRASSACQVNSAPSRSTATTPTRDAQAAHADDRGRARRLRAHAARRADEAEGGRPDA